MKVQVGRQNDAEDPTRNNRCNGILHIDAVKEKNGRLWIRCSVRAGVRPGDRATWLYLANDAGRIVGGWDPARGIHLDDQAAKHQ